MRAHPIVSAVLIGCAGLILLAIAWLTPIHTGANSCGSLIGSLGTFTNHSVRNPCQHARTQRLVVGLVIAGVFSMAPWAVLLAAGWKKLGAK